MTKAPKPVTPVVLLPGGNIAYRMPCWWREIGPDGQDYGNLLTLPCDAIPMAPVLASAPVYEHWSESADRISSGTRLLLGEGDDGNWYVRHLFRDTYRRASWWNPHHWFAYLGSRITRRLVWLERAGVAE
ncbi:hypothetical protein [Nocardia farcinica]|uniref:hypothetical protein n=1 Tax=Nocardia farcinica TaxID=37329 RepID=UPI00245391BF|nr:hypothetical protein [Nocardia farcinica]